jgi:ubiquitin fusion degradation protein 1
MMMDDRRFAARPEHYDEFFKAYSMAMLPGRERANVSYGGKIIMPSSALARLTQMEIESPWMFELSNAGVNLADIKTTHAGVLEFIAEEGSVHLPAWMMRQLNLSEGDPIRLRGKMLPKGKLVKIEPQTVDFLEISDPKAVLEGALNNFSTLTKGDVIEFSYNCLTFEILILETQPDAEGINIIDTDLEVDFAPPKGYVEPKREPKKPPPTMASKLNINTEQYDSISLSGTSTPRSNDGGVAGASNGATSGSGSDAVVAGRLSGPFVGQGQSLSGKKPKAKNRERPIEAVANNSLIRRTDQPRIITNDTQLGEKKVPAALNLPFGKLFFGYDFIPLGGKQPGDEKAAGMAASQVESFAGSGQTLSGRAPKNAEPASVDDSKNSAKGTSSTNTGRTLGTRGSTRRREVINLDDDDDDD